MRKFNLLSFGLALTMMSSPFVSSAQKMLNFETNWYKDYVGNRVSTVSPANLAKEFVYTISNDGSGGANEWGGAIPDTGILNADLVKASPYDACNPIPNTVAGKVVLVERGNCEFSQKAKTVQDAGGIAIIIVNNIAGGPVGMGAGSVAAQVSIPVIMISKADGDVLAAALDASTPITVSLSKWGNNFANDIGILNNGVTGWTEYAIPLNQLSGSVSKAQYKGVNGGVVANFGSNTATNVKFKTTVTWTPTGGSASVVRVDSVMTASFAPGDSIISPFVNELYNLTNPTTTGRYDFTYEVSSDSTDQFPNDNITTQSMYVTSNVLSKGRFDFTKNSAVSTVYYAFANSTEFIWGPLHYISNGGFKIEDVQFSLSQSGGGDMSGAGTINMLFWKWQDANSDEIIQAGETTIVGLASKEYKAGDTSGQVFAVPVTEVENTSAPVITESNTWYWVTASVPSGLFLACDGEKNYYPRSFARANVTTGTMNEYHMPIFQGSEATFRGTPTTEPQMYPFEATNDLDSVRYSQQKKGTIPSLPLRLGIFPTTVKNTVASAINIKVYPNPAADVLNVSVKLDKQASKVYYTVLDATGKRVSEEVHSNVLSETHSIATSKFAAGNYFLVINANDKVTMKQFSVTK